MGWWLIKQRPGPSRLWIYCAALLLLLLTANSCSLLSTTQVERVRRFERDLNESRYYIHQNFVSTIADHTAIQTPLNTWDVWFVKGAEDYSITEIVATDDTVTAVIDGPEAFGGPKEIVFKMVRVAPFDWFIIELDLAGTNLVS